MHKSFSFFISSNMRGFSLITFSLFLVLSSAIFSAADRLIHKNETDPPIFHSLVSSFAYALKGNVFPRGYVHLVNRLSSSSVTLFSYNIYSLLDAGSTSRPSTLAIPPNLTSLTLTPAVILRGFNAMHLVLIAPWYCLQSEVSVTTLIASSCFTNIFNFFPSHGFCSLKKNFINPMTTM